MDWDAATWISLAALALSAFGVWWQNRVTGRAHFTAEWEDTHSLVLINHGPGPATKVEATLPLGKREQKLESAYVGAFQTMRFNIIRTFSEQHSSTMDVRWRDNRLRAQHVAIDLPDPPSSGDRPAAPSVGRGELEKAVRAVAAEEAQRALKAAGARAGRSIRRG
jgi:hypothetical protein